jgi:outer membrane protein OmpA-like peptidoglycan-associated protein
MVSPGDDSPQRVALFLVFGLIAIVVASVLVNVKHRGAPAERSPSCRGGYCAGTMPADASMRRSSDAASVKVEQASSVLLASGKADLAAGASKALTDVVKGAQAGRKVAISGFHDATGDADQNANSGKTARWPC